MNVNMRFLPALVGVLAVSAGKSTAQFSWPGCGDLSDGQFNVVELMTKGDHQLEEPIKMAFDKTDAGVDVYVVERKGRVLVYEAAGGQVSTVGNIDTETGSEDGLAGIALDPDFKTNHWMYLYYSDKEDFRVVRVVARDKTLDMSTVKLILSIPSDRSTWHTGGAMAFDAYGDLWIGVGDNKLLDTGPANTNDLRGKILRIHPIAFSDTESPADGPGSTYEIPEGNLFPPGTEKTRPEIFIMGSRNSYSIALDPVRRWVAWGGYGPDHTGGNSEEYNLFTQPVNAGFPYWAGDKTLSENYSQQLKGGGSKDSPKNDHSDNTGLTQLPPAKDPLYNIGKSGSVTGPIYRYDGDLQSNVKFPPHFHRKWFITNFNYGWIKATAVSEDGSSIDGFEDVLDNVPVHAPLDFQVGPDGAFYLLNYAGWFGSSGNTKVLRIEYTGDCHPAEPKAEVVSTGRGAPGARQYSSRLQAQVTLHGGVRTIQGPEGWKQADVYDLEGRLLMSLESKGNSGLVLPQRGKPALRIVKFR